MSASGDYVSLLEKKDLFHLLVLSFLKFSLTAARFVFIAQALGLPISPHLLVFGTPLGQMAYVFSITPGGLGIFEAGWFAVLTYGGILPADASVFVIGQRVYIVIFVFLLAALNQVVMLLWRNEKQKKV